MASGSVAIPHPSPWVARWLAIIITRGSKAMGDFTSIREHTEIVGADGVRVGTVDKVEGDRIKLTKDDSGAGGHEGHHHFIGRGLVAEVEGDKVRLSATAANALMFEEEEGGDAV